MGKIQNTRKSLLRLVAVATGARLLAVVAGVGMAPAGAAKTLRRATVEAAVVGSALVLSLAPGA